MITWSDVTVIAPELADVGEDTQTAILSMVEEQLASSVWGTRLASGQRYLAAHLATMATKGSGAITAESLGDHSRTYAAPQTALDSTTYGREYQRLLRTLAGAFCAVA